MKTYNFKKDFFKISLNMNITWSKIMGLLILIAGTYIETTQSLNGIVFIASLPFITFLITGRWIKEVKEENNKLKKDIELKKIK